MRRSSMPSYQSREMPMDFLDRPPPYDLEAETCVLGSVLIRPEMIDAVRRIIGPPDFHSDANQRVFGHLLALHDEGKHGDVTLLRSRLKQAGDFDDVGGDAYLIELKRAVPTATNAEQYAGIVRQKSLLRQAIRAALIALRDAYSPDGESLRIAAVAESAFAAVRMAAGDTGLDERPLAV
jgi:replicative DNA helicase